MQAGLLGDGNDRAERVEEVDEEENKDDVEQANVERGGNVERESAGGHLAPRPRQRRPDREPHGCRCGGDRQNPEENGAGYAARLQRGDQQQPARREQGVGRGQIAQGD